MVELFTEHYADQLDHIDRIIDLFAPLDNNETELRVTLYAEWNNRLIEGQPTDDTTLCTAANQCLAGRSPVAVNLNSKKAAKRSIRKATF